MEQLKQLGFSPSEIKIYLHLLRKGISYAKKISMETKINRTNVYEALDRLSNKGVISFITRNKVKWFEAKNPDSIQSIIKEKQEDLVKIKNSLKKLKKIKQESSLEANVFIGKKGLRTLFEDILKTKKPICLLASELQFKKIFGPYFELWHKKRIENKILQRSIFPKKIKNKLKARKLLKYKFVDNKFINPTTTIIYGNNCIFIQWSKDPIAIKINNKDISKSHQNYFNLLWD
ncbi:TrmB family transcriptional regulator [Nanoarchaeota archaeon]